jgi:hypothetical protein
MYGYPYINVARQSRVDEPLFGSRLYSPYRFEPGEPDSDQARPPKTAAVAILVAYVLIIGVVLAALSIAGPGDDSGSGQAARDFGCTTIGHSRWSGCMPRLT